MTSETAERGVSVVDEIVAESVVRAVWSRAPGMHTILIDGAAALRRLPARRRPAVGPSAVRQDLRD